MEAKEGQLTLYATDLHTGMKTSVGGKIETEGKVAVPSKTFVEYVASLQAGMLTLEASADGLTLGRLI
jgi:DNA polymerase III sliding clamp (beta) subunit (PCNA family)